MQKIVIVVTGYGVENGQLRTDMAQQTLEDGLVVESVPLPPKYTPLPPVMSGS